VIITWKAKIFFSQCFLSLFAIQLANATTFCFPKKTSLKAVQQYLQPLILAKDNVEIYTTQNCLDINLDSGRERLFQKYLKRRYSYHSNFSSGISTREKNLSRDNHCRLKIDRESRNGDVSRKISLKGRKNKILRGDKKAVNDISTSQLLLSLGKHGRIKMGDQDVRLTCIQTSFKGVEVEVSIQSIKTQSYIGTTVSVEKGQRVNLGDVVRVMSRGGHGVSLRDGLEYDNSQLKTVTKWFLKYE